MEDNQFYGVGLISLIWFGVGSSSVWSPAAAPAGVLLDMQTLQEPARN